MLRVGILVAALSTVLGTTTYYIVRDVLLEEQQRSASEQFSTNARVLADALRSPDVDEVALLASLRPEVRARELLLSDGEWFSASLQVQPSDLPSDLVEQVRSGRPSSQRFRLGSDLVVALGAPIAEGDHYFEVFSLQDVGDTLGTLRRTLLAVGIAATVAGVGVGAWIGRRVAEPLERVSLAAAEIADGALDTRLEDGEDEELARIAGSFNRMAASLAERIQRESQFAADVSHELRSPLTTLVNAVSVLERRRDELSPDAQEALTLLSGDITRFERMVTDLIEISKHDSGSLPVEPEDLAIEGAVASVLRRNAPSVPVRVTPNAENAMAHIDLQRFERALTNVVRNADSYAGGATCIEIDRVGDRIRIAVDDEGPGVPIDERRHVFERFARGVQGERRHTADGSGLGLAIARENMARLGGTISVTDNPEGRGARFVLELPVSAA